MKPTFIVLVLCALWAGSAAAAEEQADQAVRDGIASTLNQLDTWAAKAKEAEGQLTEVQTTIDEIKDTHDALRQAVILGGAGGDSDRALSKLSTAVGKWKPEWAGHLDDLQEVQRLLRTHAPQLYNRSLTINQALTRLATHGRDINGRVVEFIDSTGVEHRLKQMLRGDGPLGSALTTVRTIRGRWNNLNAPRNKYLELVQQVDTLYKPRARSTYSGLESIQRILDEFKDRAPPPVDKILGAYADIVGGFVGALKRVEATIDHNTRQSLLAGTMRTEDQAVLAAIEAAHPDFEKFQITEITPLPSYAPAGSRLFGHIGKHDVRYLLVGGKAYRLFGPEARVRRVARWSTIVRGAVQAAEVEATLDRWPDIRAMEQGPFEKAYRTWRGQLPVLRDYLRVLHGEGSDFEHWSKKLYRWKSMDREEALAHWALDEMTRHEMDAHTYDFRNKILVQARVARSGEGALDQPLHVWARADNWSREELLTLRDDRWQALVTVSEHTRQVFVGARLGALDRDERNVFRPVPPSRVTVDLALEVPPPEPEDTEPPDPDELAGRNQDDGDGPDDVTDENGVGSNTGEDADGDREELDEDELTERSDEDTSDEEEPNATDDLPPELDEGLHEDFVIAVLAGDEDEATRIMQEMGGLGENDARDAVRTVMDELGDATAREDAAGPDEEPYDGAPPPDDQDVLSEAGIDDIDEGADDDGELDPPAEPDEELLADPGEDDGGDGDAEHDEGDDFTTARDRDRDRVGKIRDRQQAAAGAARAAGTQAVGDYEPPTLGGMDNIRAPAGVDQVTITVWDHGDEDGDIVSIDIDGRRIASELTLTNAQRSFTAQLGGTFSIVRIIAHNTGDGGPNTASMQVSAGGRVLESTKWGLQTMEVGASTIRRGD